MIFICSSAGVQCCLAWPQLQSAVNSAFNTVMPPELIRKGPFWLCSRASLSLHSGVPQGCVLTPFVSPHYSAFVKMPCIKRVLTWPEVTCAQSINVEIHSRLTPPCLCALWQQVGAENLILTRFTLVRHFHLHFYCIFQLCGEKIEAVPDVYWSYWHGCWWWWECENWGLVAQNLMGITKLLVGLWNNLSATASDRGQTQAAVVS